MAEQRQLKLVLKLQDEATRDLRKISGDLGGIAKSTNKVSTGFAGFARNIAGVAAAYFSFKQVYNGLKLGLTVAADLQTAEIGLKTLLGTAEEARRTVERIKVEAKRTPFELTGLAQATQLLASVTKDGDKAIDIILDVGEGLAAMGKGQAELDRIIINLQQIAATGKAMTIDIKQFAFAGLPIYEMLSEATGKYGEDLQELISTGGVTFDVIADMFDKANDEGGQFFNAYKNQAGSFNQATSNMKDSLGIFLSDVVIASGLFDAMTNAMIGVSDWLGNWKEELQSLRQTIVDYIELIDEKTGLITLLKDAWKSVVDVFNSELRPALMELWEALEPYKPYIEALAQVLGAALIGSLVLVILFLGAMAKSIIKAVTWTVKFAEALSTSLIKGLDWVTDRIEGLIGFVGNLIDKLKEAWEWLKKVGSKESIINLGSKINPFMKARASGGPVSAGTPYLVGERGPEVFTPGVSGNIIPNGAGAGGMIVNVVVQGDVSGEDLIEKVKDSFMSELRMNTKLAL